MSDARATILERVRKALAADPGRRPALPPVPGAPAVPQEEHHERFRTTLERVGGRVERLASVETVHERVLGIVRERRAEQVAVSHTRAGDPLERLCQLLLPEVEVVTPASPRDELFASAIGITCAQWGIAETGTLVLESAGERHRLISLVPPVHVALLPARALLGTLGEALAAVRASGGAPASRTITFVTGPSRTADIELTLVVGVHGPRELHVLVHD